MSYAVGNRVRARAGDPDHHTRLPRYVRGQAGRRCRAARRLGAARRFGRGLATTEQCYAVRFAAADLFGSGDHTVTVDLWESYLERA